MSQAIPRAGERVSVLEFGRWLDGVVLEANAASAEFLVDFDDEAEVQAWVSVGQPWRSLGADDDGAEVPASSVDEQPALPTPPPPPPPAERATTPPLLPENGAAEPPSDANEAEEWHRLLLEQFAELHRATVQADGCGAEAPDATRERFARLHAVCSSE